MGVRLCLAALVTATFAAYSPAHAEPVQPNLIAAVATAQDTVPQTPTQALAAAEARTIEERAAVGALPDLPEATENGLASGERFAAPADAADSRDFGLAYQLAVRDSQSLLGRLTSRVKQLVSQAMSYLGTPYRRGGSSRRGLDCSGLVGAVYGEQGLEMPRTAAEQFLEGTPVTMVDLRAGDLVFFRDTYKRGISHVGIYLGEGRFIHAAGKRQGVIVSELDRPYFRRRFAGARRVAVQVADSLATGAPGGSSGQSNTDGNAAGSTPASALRNR